MPTVWLLSASIRLPWIAVVAGAVPVVWAKDNEGMPAAPKQVIKPAATRLRTKLFMLLLCFYWFLGVLINPSQAVSVAGT